MENKIKRRVIFLKIVAWIFVLKGFYLFCYWRLWQDTGNVFICQLQIYLPIIVFGFFFLFHGLAWNLETKLIDKKEKNQESPEK